MKVTGYIWCALVFTYMLNVACAEKSRSKLQQQLLDGYATDETLKIKRPFCNAFTGCGIKRSFYGSLKDNQEMERNENVHLPVSFYEALLRSASRDIRSRIQRGIGVNRLPEIQDMYFTREIPIHERLDLSPTDVD
ncbi:hypothetical protein KM043_006459 [Ampulex compressa]|nr:hypothetical protein KM043_006459 [Ampulex compressa]